MNSDIETERLARNFVSLKRTIQKRIEGFEAPREREAYINKIIKDCDKILDIAFVLGEYEIDGEFIKRLGFDIDENLIRYLDDAESFYVEDELSSVKDKAEYYIVTKVGKGNKSEIKSCIDGIELIKEVLNSELNKEGIKEAGETHTNIEGIERLKIKSSFSDIVRIFEAMKQAGIISDKTPVRQFAELFFSDISGQIRFERNYNATKNRIEKLKSTSNSKELLDFILLMIENCFKGKDLELEKIVRHIEYLQKNII